MQYPIVSEDIAGLAQLVLAELGTSEKTGQQVLESIKKEAIHEADNRGVSHRPILASYLFTALEEAGIRVCDYCRSAKQTAVVNEEFGVCANCNEIAEGIALSTTDAA